VPIGGRAEFLGKAVTPGVALGRAVLCLLLLRAGGQIHTVSTPQTLLSPLHCHMQLVDGLTGGQRNML
jgi:hypothetical protein